MKNKFVLFIATEKGYTTLNFLLENNLSDCIACVVTFKEIGTTKQWCDDILTLCKKSSIEHYYWADVKNNIDDLVITSNASGAIAISWKYMLPLSINKLLKVNLIVFHDSLLPKYRGFAPTPSAIINGEKYVGVTALYAGENADDGDILMQTKMEVLDSDCIKSVINKQANIYAQMTANLINKINKGTITAKKQDDTKATYSIWRDEEDYHIDWNANATTIKNSVRALSEPYMGAYTLIDGQKVVLGQVEIVQDMHFEIRQPGKIWLIKNNEPLVVCGKGMIKIIKAYDMDNNIYKFNKLRVRLK